MQTPPKRVLCLMDLSVVGRAGLSVAAPVLAACGVQACLLPTALFSAHTGGFGPVEKQDEAAFARRALAHYQREGLAFDAIYTGYLYGEAQFALAKAALAAWPGALHVADPAMADDGRLYTGLDDDTVAQMAALCRNAWLITPNYTEAALLLGAAAGTTEAQLPAAQRLEALARLAPNVLITSCPGTNDASDTNRTANATNAGYTTLGQAQSGQPFALPSRRVPQHYPGTGDMLCAAVTGLLLAGRPLKAAAAAATAFVEEAAHRTHAAGGDARCGLWLEPCLPRLAQAAGLL